MKKVSALTVASLLALALSASAEETKPLSELDALRLEKAEVEIQMLMERAARIRSEAQGYARELSRREGTEGWQLDLPQRRWVKPDPPGANKPTD